MKGLKLNLYKKVVAIFTITIIPLLVIGFMINLSGESIIEQNMEESLDSRVKFYMNSFELEMSRVIRMKQHFMVDNDVQTLAMHHVILSDIERITTTQNVQRKLKQFKDSSLFVEGIKLYLPSLDRNIQDDLIETGFPREELEALDRMEAEARKIALYQDQLIMRDSYPRSILRESSPQIYMEIILSKEKIEKTLRNISPNDKGETIIFDQQGDWHLGKLPKKGGTIQGLLEIVKLDPAHLHQQGRFELLGITYLYAYQWSPALQATLMVYVNEGELLGSLNWYKKLFWILGITSIVVTIFFSIWIYRLIHKPMHLLTSAFRRLEKGDIPLVLNHNRKDEFQYLYDQYQQMAGRLKQLIEDIYEQELRMNRSELKQLQAQINPHFLYNIFFLLNRILQLEDTETAKRITVHLGKYFRYITRNSQDEVSLGEEIEHIRAYVAIQTVRFGSRLKAELDDFPLAVEEIRVPRLILQPLVENAFEHGLEDNPDIGRLRISYEADGHHVEMIIADNGTTLSDERLSELQAHLQSVSAAERIETTGLLNVHRRLQLQYGEKYGLTLSRSQWNGLEVKVHIPILPVKNKEE